MNFIADKSILPYGFVTIGWSPQPKRSKQLEYLVICLPLIMRLCPLTQPSLFFMLGTRRLYDEAFMKVTELKTFVVGNPPPHTGGRYFIFVKLTTDGNVVGYAGV